jgi:hypothetical protein
MAVNLRPHSERGPLLVEEDEYERLCRRTAAGGWSQCTDEVEWLAKLHYLRAGLKAGKLSQAEFEQREVRLVEGWLRKRL